MAYLITYLLFRDLIFSPVSSVIASTQLLFHKTNPFSNRFVLINKSTAISQ